MTERMQHHVPVQIVWVSSWSGIAFFLNADSYLAYALTENSGLSFGSPVVLIPSKQKNFDIQCGKWWPRVCPIGMEDVIVIGSVSDEKITAIFLKPDEVIEQKAFSPHPLLVRGFGLKPREAVVRFNVEILNIFTKVAMPQIEGILIQIMANGAKLVTWEQPYNFEVFDLPQWDIGSEI